MTKAKRVSASLGLAAFTPLFILAAPAAFAQSGLPGSTDTAAAAAAKSWHRLLPARTPAGAKLGHDPIPAVAHANGNGGFGGEGQTRYPADLTFFGGPVVGNAQSHAIYLVNPNCSSPSCWGNPETFLQDLGRSNFIHITDQYVNRYDSNRYTVGSNALIHFPLSPPLTDSFMLAVVHFVAAQTHQNGYNHVYHVFLAPGQDECIDNGLTQCYSPDNPATFAFCAYHGSVDFSDIGHVLYSVEPFQNVAGCADRPGTPNGPVVDSTADVLSHELFETITDPDGTGWWNLGNLNELGSEIADECTFVVFLPNIFDPNAVGYGDPALVQMGGKTFAVQPEYSNFAHACVTTPWGG